MSANTVARRTPCVCVGAAGTGEELLDGGRSPAALDETVPVLVATLTEQFGGNKPRR